MADIALLGRASSVNVQKAMWALDEVGVAHRQIELGGRFGGMDDPAYRAINPNGKVPTLRDGDLVVWESHAIVRYLAGTYGAGSLWPVAPAARAVVDQWTDWTATTLQPAWIEVFWSLVRTPVAQHDKTAIGKALLASYAAYAIMEERLSRVPYLSGDVFSYADIVAGASMHRWMTMSIQRPDMPNLLAWYVRLQERPGYRRAIAVSYDDMVGRLSF
jgi:glutathione S-transferase